MKALAVALVLGGFLTVGLAQPATTAASGPNSVFVDADNDCNSSNRQVSSLPAASGVFYVWLNTGTIIDSTDVYDLVLEPLTPGGTTLVGPQPVNFLQCSSSTWAWAEVGYGGFKPGTYAWLVFDASGQFLGGDTVRYV
jgi:hypothetical protein